MQGAEKAANIWEISLNMQQRDLYNKLHQRVRGAISTAEPSQKIGKGVKGRFKLNMQDPGITIEKEKYSLVYSPTGKIYRGGVFWYHKIDLGDLDAGSISCCSRSAKTKREQSLPQCREALKTRGKLRKFGSQWKKSTSAVYTPPLPASIPACRNQSKPGHSRKNTFC